MGNRYFFAHRLIYFIATGEEPDYIDHINGDRSDNRIENLRAATNSQNMANQQRRRPVWVYRQGRKWYGRIMKNYRTHRIRPADTKEEAEQRVAELRARLHGEFGAC